MKKIIILSIFFVILGYFFYQGVNKKEFIGQENINTSISTSTNSTASTTSNTCDSHYDAEPEEVIRCDIHNNLVFVYTPGKKAEIIKKIDNQVLNTFYPYDWAVSDEYLEFGFDGSLMNFEFVDINFDGIRDLQVLQYSGAYNPEYNFYIYDVKEGKYRLEPILKDLINPWFEEVKGDGFVYSFYKGRGLGDIYSNSEFKYNKNTFQYEEIKNCVRNFLSDDHSDMENGYYYFCKTPDSKNEWKISTLTFDGVGNERVRSCPSFDCSTSTIKRDALKPEIEFIKKEGDWFEVNYVDKGKVIVDDMVEEMLESQWVKTKGWIYTSDVPKEIQNLINQN